MTHRDIETIVVPGYRVKNAFAPNLLGRGFSYLGRQLSRGGRFAPGTKSRWAANTAGTLGTGFGATTALRYPGQRERDLTQGYTQAFNDTNIIDKFRAAVSPQFRKEWLGMARDNYAPSMFRSGLRAMPTPFF